jgi:hypothetical protein
MTKAGETPTGTSKRPSSEGSTPVERVRPPKRPRHSCGPLTYKGVLTNIKTAIFKGNCPEDTLTEDDQDHILEELGRVFLGTPIGELQLLSSFRLGEGALIHVCGQLTITG